LGSWLDAKYKIIPNAPKQGDEEESSQ